MRRPSRLLPLVLALSLLACSTTSSDIAARKRPIRPVATPQVVHELQERTFQWFWDTTNPENGLVPDRWPTPSFSSVAAVGYGLTALGIGAERGWVTREAAAARALATLRFFRDAPQGPASSAVTGYKGFLYHFLDMKSGERFETVELSTIDTALFLSGALFCQSYFDRDNAAETEIRAIVEELYRRAEWDWAVFRPPFVCMAWTPETGFGTHDWRGYDEAMIVYILALGSPTHPVAPEAWSEWTTTYEWKSYYGYEHVNFAPLFGHQYSHMFVDFRGIQDEYMRGKGIDYFENARRATLAQREYAIDNPMEWEGYGENLWGLTACDGPVDAELDYKGTKRRFFTYAARGASATEVRDDGTIAPTAAASSIAFAPEIAIPAIEELATIWGPLIYTKFGFLDSFNPSFKYEIPVRHGRVDPALGWVDGDYLGIDQGPIVIMIENYRSGLVWNTLRKNPHVVRGLRRAGFTGGWLDTAP
ncbi:MAG: glucoamylase family protein [Thermoanaerobaculia bacterium]